MSLRVDLVKWRERIEDGWQGVEQGDITQALDMLARLVPELEMRIDKARNTITSGSVFVVLDGDKDTGEVLVFEVTTGPFTSPDHVHNRSQFANYGERIWTLEGAIVDVADDGIEVTQTKFDTVIEHGPDTRHRTRIDRWWMGIFYQPAGSRLV